MRILSLFSLISVLLFFGCAEEPEKRKKTPPPAKTQQFQPVEKPNFSADSAYSFVAKQVEFGPRVPGSKAHEKAANYFKTKMSEWNWDTEIQLGEATTFNGKNIEIKNIIARFDTSNKNRVLLMAHWDSRPFADRDDSRKNEAIDGANDGASGVGVLMEIARAINSSELKPRVGIDIIFFDAEDYGQPSSMMGGQTGDTWCLGSQYWAKNLSPDYTKPKYGILLDMVGAKNAVFPKEGVSMKYNPQLVNNVWYLANKLGYGKFFIQEEARGGITDDHLYVNKLAGIPSIDIIHYNPYKSDFGNFHHKHADDLSIIDKKTLHVVGEVVLEVVYRE